MIKVSLDIWLLAICIVFPSLCLVMTIYIYFKRGRKLSRESNFHNSKQNRRKFADEIAFHLACQQLDDLMINTIDTIERQRQFLNKYIDKQYKNNFNLSEAEIGKEHIIKEISSEKNGLRTADRSYENDTVAQVNATVSSEVDSDYRRIAELFQSGMTSKQISETTQIPQSEIDLYIKLHLKKVSIEKPPLSLLRLSV